MSDALLRVKSLSVAFRQRGEWVPVVDEVDFEVYPGEILALVGESGCGKSVSVMAVGQLLSPENSRISGSVQLQSERGIMELLTCSDRQMRAVRGRRLGYIFQEPGMCLNPVLRVSDQLRESFEIHSDVNCTESAIEAMLAEVGIPDPKRRMRCYPHELSGGMQQRVMIAMALAAKPDLLIADEPTTALDVTVQAQILRLIADLQRKRGMSVILITHNFGLVGALADRVMVMYAGQIIESGSAAELIRSPLHPYTRSLLAAVPEIGADIVSLPTIPGRVPAPGKWKTGCRFSDRCSCVQACCTEQNCILREVSQGHFSRCFVS